MSDLVWTKETPTKPGCYFFRGAPGNSAYVVQIVDAGDSSGIPWVPQREPLVIDDPGSKSRHTGTWTYYGPVDVLRYEWAGPIKEPVEWPQEPENSQ